MAARKLSRKDAFFLAVLYAMTFVTAFNESIMNVALLDISDAFAISPETGQWLITGYMIVAAITTACSGFLSRAFRTRTLFVYGIGALMSDVVPAIIATVLSIACLVAFVIALAYAWAMKRR